LRIEEVEVSREEGREVDLAGQTKGKFKLPATVRVLNTATKALHCSNKGSPSFSSFEFK
jgi:hypothetical protein